jgi:hypothetical protein
LLLLLTNSLDGSSDVISLLCRELSLPLFRLNVDLFSEYKMSWTKEGFWVDDPTGRRVESASISSCYVRKPNFPTDEVLNNEKSWVEAQVLYVVRELVNWCKRRSLLRLVEPGAERRFGKLSQLELARKYFSVPDWTMGWNVEFATQQPKRIVKTLDARLIEGEFLFARSVEPSKLAKSYPWFVQDIAPGEVDATVVYLNGKSFAFRLVKPREGSHEDWRVLIHTADCVWERYELPTGVESSIHLFMKEARLHFGRLDFVVEKERWSFLEVNPNGQYGWLDNETLWLHREVLGTVLDGHSTVTI